MGVGAGLYMYDVVVKKFTFAISSPDEFLSKAVVSTSPEEICFIAAPSNFYGLFIAIAGSKRTIVARRITFLGGILSIGRRGLQRPVDDVRGGSVVEW